MAEFENGNSASAGVSEGKTGRKSAYEEFQSAKFISDVWDNAQDIESLENKVKSKRYSGREITALRLLKGSERLMSKFMDKLVPDLHEHSGPGRTPLFLPSEILTKHDIKADSVDGSTESNS